MRFCLAARATRFARVVFFCVRGALARRSRWDGWLGVVRGRLSPSVSCDETDLVEHVHVRG